MSWKSTQASDGILVREEHWQCSRAVIIDASSLFQYIDFWSWGTLVCLSWAASPCSLSSRLPSTMTGPWGYLQMAAERVKINHIRYPSSLNQDATGDRERERERERTRTCYIVLWHASCTCMYMQACGRCHEAELRFKKPCNALFSPNHLYFHLLALQLTSTSSLHPIHDTPVRLPSPDSLLSNFGLHRWITLVPRCRSSVSIYTF